MGEQPKNKPEQKQEYRQVYTGKTLEQWIAEQEAPQYRASKQAPIPQNFGNQPRAQYSPMPPQAPHAERIKPRRSPHGRARQIGLKVIAMTGAGLLAAGGTAYAFNVGGIREIFAPDVSASAGLKVNPLETLGTESLAPNQCSDPDAVLMVAKVSGAMNLAPLIATTENATPMKAVPYLNEKNMAKLPKDQQSTFSHFITDEQYPQATVNELPLALSICEPIGANAITEQDGALVINRSALTVTFEDPDSLFNENIINAVYQIDGATVETDTELGQYMTLPNPANNLFLSPGADKVYNQSITDISAAMATPTQLQVLLAMMEISAIQQLDNVVDGQENIDYPNGANSLQQAIDQALVKRLIGDKKTNLSFTGNYNTQMDVAKDPTTKQPITAIDPATNANPLKGLDAAQKFIISNIAVEFGSLNPPGATSKPEPSPTTTTKPEATPEIIPEPKPTEIATIQQPMPTIAP